VTLITFPLGDGILCLSATPKADMNKIPDKVMKVLRSRNRSKPPRKKRNKQIKNRAEY
jgi:hypothetical protein